MLLNFVDAYLDGLVEFTHPKWFVACFTHDPTNPAQWAHYGDDHKGVCLVFDSVVVDELRLEFREMVEKCGNDKMQKSYASLAFDDIDYVNQLGYINFFESIGHLRSSCTKDLWYVDEHGNRSDCAPKYDSDWGEQKWALSYMRQFVKNLFMKTKDWDHEKEARVIMTARDPEIPVESMRSWNYSFSDLKGIIFGMRTTTEQILEIKRIIDVKCAKTGRVDFEYWRAYYCAIHGVMEMASVDQSGEFR